MTCAEASERIELWPLGALEPEAEAELEAHLAACAACAAASAALRAAYGALADEVAAATAAPLADELRARALAAGLAAGRNEMHTGTSAEREDGVGVGEKKPVVREGPALDPVRVEAVGKQIALTCSYCHARTAREEVVFCASCLAPHHAECFREHGRCSLPGCEEDEAVRPGRLEPAATAAPTPPRRGRKLVLRLLVTCLAAGSAAALTTYRARRADEARRLEAEVERALLDEDPRARRAAIEAADLAEAAQEDEALEAPGKAAATAERRVTLELEGASLQDAATELGRQAGVNVLVAPGVQETVSVTLREIPWNEALSALAAMARCEVERRGGGVWLLTQAPRVTIQLTDANIHTVLQLLAAYSGRNIVLGSEVQGRFVSPNLVAVRWDAAVVAVAHAAGCQAWVVRGGESGPSTGNEVVYVGTTAPQGGVPLAPGGALESSLDRTLGRAVTLDLRDATLQAACAELSRAAGVAVEVRGLRPDDPRRITLPLRDSPWQQALHLLAQRADCEVELRAEGATVRPAIRIGRLEATRLRVDDLVALLSQVEADREAALNVVVGRDAGARTVTLDLSEVRPVDALHGALAQAGCELIEEAGATVVHARPGSEQAPTGDRSPVAKLELRAVVLGGPSGLASISGRAVRVGEPLVDEDGHELGELVAVEAGEARLRRSDGRIVRLVLGETSGVLQLESEPAPSPSLGLACQDEVPGEVRVEDVQVGSTAAAAGVHKGDLLLALEVGGKAHEPKRLEDLKAPLDGAAIGAPVTFVVRRGAETLRLSAELRARPR